MINRQHESDGHIGFAEVNPNPVLSSGADGVLHFANPATSQLLGELDLVSIEDILPENHHELAADCLETGTIITRERHTCGRVLVWSYLPAGNNTDVYIYGHDVSDYQAGTHGSMEFPFTNPSPVLSSGADGELHFVNPATSQLLQDLKLRDIKALLPTNHEKLIRDCQKSSTTITGERKVGDRTLAWLYRASSDADEIFIYGHDLSGSDPRIFCIEGFPKANPNPIFSSGADGVPRFMNHATSQLLQDLELESTEDILPHNHKELINICLTSSKPVIRERKVAGRTLIWSYHPIDDSDLVYIYGHDITGYKPDTF
jgi:hypothetical protein